MRNLNSASWWKAVVFRMLRTAGVILTPYVPTILYTGDYAIVVSVVGFGALGSFITSLAGIAETEGKNVVWYYAIMERAVKTAAQALLTLFGTAAMFQDVDWAQAPQLVGTAVLGSLLIGFMGFLPETSGDPLAPTELTNVTINNAGRVEQTSTPVVASVALEGVDDTPREE